MEIKRLPIPLECTFPSEPLCVANEEDPDAEELVWN